jgi:hypothetical protein
MAVPGKEPTERRIRAMAVEQVNGEAGDLFPHTIGTWAHIVDKLAFPIVAFGVAVALAVGYHNHVRQDSAAVRMHFSQQVDKLTKAQRDDRDALIKALEKQTALLERIEQRLLTAVGARGK